jgi:(5-formylfuran-3-yl)methyl phosphate synthase
MTKFLASVRDEDEAEIALSAGADIIDLKDPSRGVLGALALPAIAACAKRIAGRAAVSATIGDLPMHGETVNAMALATAACGVDYVKVGLFPEGDEKRCLDELGAVTDRVCLILVIFADAMPDFDAVAAASRIGAHGVMLDTAGKNSGTLPDHLSYHALAAFVAAARAFGLSVGLAGSLRPKHVAPLLRLEPDLIGFRSALCQGAARDAALDPAACAAIRKLIPRDAASTLPGLTRPSRHAYSELLAP